MQAEFALESTVALRRRYAPGVSPFAGIVELRARPGFARSAVCSRCATTRATVLGEATHGGADLFATEFERAADARAYLDARWETAQLFRAQRCGERSEDRTVGDGCRDRGTKTSRGGRETRSGACRRNFPTDAGHRARPSRPCRVSMGSRWRGYFVSGSNGACMVRFEIPSSTHACFWKGHDCGPQDFARWAFREFRAGAQPVAREPCRRQRARSHTRRDGRDSQGGTRLGVSRRAGDQDGVLVVAGFFRDCLSRNGRTQSLAIPNGRILLAER